MEQSFDQFNAALLVLPDGELYDYTCQTCHNSVGSKTERAGTQPTTRKTRLGG
jgi:hypothetical protein